MKVSLPSPFEIENKTNQAKAAQPTPKEQWGLFVEKLNTAIEEVDALAKNSEKLTQDLVLGRADNLHEVMIAAEKAKTAMNLTIELRNKAIEAYKEIMRMNF